VLYSLSRDYVRATPITLRDPFCPSIFTLCLLTSQSITPVPVLSQEKQLDIDTMPSYQGIKLDVISQLELRIHPEFPHPESSQFTYRSTSTTGETSSSLVSSSVSSDSKADKILGRPSTISVYIPSHPGEFWLPLFMIFMSLNSHKVLGFGCDTMYLEPQNQRHHGTTLNCS
jgi:hypothetical protein